MGPAKFFNSRLSLEQVDCTRFVNFSALVECHLDAGKVAEASQVAAAAAKFIKKHVPGLYKVIFGLMVCILVLIL